MVKVISLTVALICILGAESSAVDVTTCLKTLITDAVYGRVACDAFKGCVKSALKKAGLTGLKVSSNVDLVSVQSQIDTAITEASVTCDVVLDEIFHEHQKEELPRAKRRANALIVLRDMAHACVDKLKASSNFKTVNCKTVNTILDCVLIDALESHPELVADDNLIVVKRAILEIMGEYNYWESCVFDVRLSLRKIQLEEGYNEAATISDCFSVTTTQDSLNCSGLSLHIKCLYRTLNVTGNNSGISDSVKQTVQTSINALKSHYGLKCSNDINELLKEAQDEPNKGNNSGSVSSSSLYLITLMMFTILSVIVLH